MVASKGNVVDGISSISPSSYLSQNPLSSSTGPSSAATTPAASDSVTLSGADAEPSTPNTYAPDAGFTTLLQTDPYLAQDYSAENQFGFGDSVLANDDTLSTGQTNTPSRAAAQSGEPATVAQQVEVGALNFNSGVMSALLSGLSDSSASLFMGSSMSSLLTSNGSAALAYLTPAAAQASGSVNLSA